MSALKDYFNPGMIRLVAKEIENVDPKFDSKKFIKLASHRLDKLEMKDRSMQIANALRETLPVDYPTAVKTLLQSLERGRLSGFTLWPYTHFVQIHGTSDFDDSLAALKEMTKLFTAEFAIRPFLESHETKTLELLAKWATDRNEHVRRLVSEGSRPLLPWGLRLKRVYADPNLTLPLLEKLKFDESEYVRRSVANHLNDFTKAHADVVVATLSRWMKETKNDGQKAKIEKIARHACRTLFKKGHRQALTLFGFDSNAKFEVSDLKILKTKVREGESLEFEFEVRATNNGKGKGESIKAMIDYAIHHMKANGSTQPKVFKLTVKNIGAEKTSLRSRHSFKSITTRKYYSGIHEIEIFVNGQSLARDKFTLLALTPDKAKKVSGSRAIPSRLSSKSRQSRRPKR